MKNIGYLLISISFLFGSYLTALDERLVQWDYFIAAMVIGVIGGVLIHLGTKSEAKDEDKISSNISIIETSINNIVNKVTTLNKEKDKINTYDICTKLDEILIDDLNNFAEARKTIGHVYGLPAFAEVMNNFAGGERYLNRVWSASADGYIDEVNAFLQHALDQFKEAQTKLVAYKAEA